VWPTSKAQCNKIGPPKEEKEEKTRKPFDGIYYRLSSVTVLRFSFDT
jgi:hypothetical protein